MKTVTECVTEAVESCMSGASFQAGIRELMQEPTTDEWTLTEVVTQFRNDIDGWACTQERKKRVNNICNDVSRICRETYGKSIVCKKKKPIYVYEALEPKPRAEKSTETVVPGQLELVEEKRLGTPIGQLNIDQILDVCLQYWSKEEVGKTLIEKINKLDSTA